MIIGYYVMVKVINSYVLMQTLLPNRKLIVYFLLVGLLKIEKRNLCTACCWTEVLTRLQKQQVNHSYLALQLLI